MFLLLLTLDAMPRPGHGVQPLLLHLAPAGHTDSVRTCFHSLEGFLNQMQDEAVIIALLKQEFFGVGIARLVGEILRRLFVGLASVLLRFGNDFKQLFSSFQKPFLVRFLALLFHRSPIKPNSLCPGERTL